MLSSLLLLLLLLLLAEATPVQVPPLITPTASAPPAARWPAHDAQVILRDFRFRSGETLPALRIGYTSLGQPHRDARGEIDNAVMILQGTGRQFLSPQFADELFGPGQPLDINRYWIILPDGIGHGNHRNLLTACTCGFRTTTMTTWSKRSTGCCTTHWVYAPCGSSWAPPWDVCTASCGVRTMPALCAP